MEGKKIIIPVYMILVVVLAYMTVTGMQSPDAKIQIAFSGMQTVLLIGIMLFVLYPDKNEK